MKTFELYPGGPAASALAFGCASVMGFHDRATSLRALEFAFERGINFFDLARSYGYGQAEALFGRFARHKRERLLIATKFGIEPDPSARANAIRLVRGGIGGLRHLRWVPASGTSRDDAFSLHWSPARLRTSVHRSLRELRSDYVDLLLLHSPPADITLRNDLFDALDRMVSAGLIRSYGLSTDIVCATQALAHARHGVRAVQYPYCAMTGATVAVQQPPPTVILNHVFGGRGTLKDAADILARLRQMPELPLTTRDKLEAAEGAIVLSDILLNGGLAVTGAQCAVVSMFTSGHIADNCNAIGNSRFTRAELRALTARLGERLVKN